MLPLQNLLQQQNDTLYFSHSNQSAFKTAGDQAPISIPAIESLLENPASQPSSDKCIAWQLSQLTETAYNLTLQESNEWQTAAGQAILNSIDICLVDAANNQILKYNKADWKNPDIRVINKTS